MSKLSDLNEVLFQQPCNHQHDKRCTVCESLKKEMVDALAMTETASNFTVKERSDFLYDIKEAQKSIESWKGHILTVIHQEKQKLTFLTK